MKHRMTIITLAILLGMTSALSGQAIAKISTFLRGQALSDAYSVYAEDCEGLYYNPASTYFGERNNFYISYASWAVDTGLFSLSYRYKFNEKWAFALHFASFFSGEISLSDSASAFSLDSDGYWNLAGNSSYSFSQNLFIANGSYFLQIGDLRFPLGVNAKIGGSGTDFHGTAFISFDLGALFLIHESFGIDKSTEAWKRRLIPERASLKFIDIGGEFDTSGYITGDPTEFEVVLGAGFDFVTVDPWYHFMFELDFSTREGLGIGFINNFTIKEIIHPQVLVGINTDFKTFTISSGFFVNVEINKMTYHLGYTFRYFNGIGLINQFSFNMDVDIDLIRSLIFRTKNNEAIDEALIDVNRMMDEGALKDAAKRLTELREEYPVSRKLRDAEKRLLDLMSEDGTNASSAPDTNAMIDETAMITNMPGESSTTNVDIIDLSVTNTVNEGTEEGTYLPEDIDENVIIETGTNETERANPDATGSSTTNTAPDEKNDGSDGITAPREEGTVDFNNIPGIDTEAPTGEP